MVNKMKKILFYCQSSLGIGHTIRSLRIAEGLSQSFEVHFLNGGEPISELEIPQGIHRTDLPPIVSDPNFNTVHAVGGDLDVDGTIEQRRNIILQAFRRVSPAIVLVELYPFGRGRFHAELEPLLRCAKKQGSKIVCSVRDILTKREDQEAFERKVVKRMNRFFDLLLIHSDPDFQRLDDTFTSLESIIAKKCYTGFVVPEVTEEPRRNGPTIIASIGGGRFGHELAEAVARTAPLLAERIPHQIELYTGPFCPEDVAQRLRRLAHGQANIRVLKFCPDLHQKLMSADLSISMGGYNTIMNVIATGVPAMIMGCTNDGGMDQVARAEKLASRGVVDVIKPEDLAPATFAEKIIGSLSREPTPVSLDTDGVTATMQALTQLSGSCSASDDHNGGEQPCVA
jgi:predicted glycosyltransferase